MPDQQGTSFKQNWADFVSAVKGDKRLDGRGRVNAILHEGLNVIVESIRAKPKTAFFVFSAIFLVVVEWVATGTFL